MKSDFYNESLRNLSEYISRGITPNYTEGNGIQVLNQKCVRDGKISIEASRLHDNKKKKVSDDKILKKNDILVNSTGVGTLGRVAQKHDETIATVDSHITIVRPKKSKVDPVFLGYLLKQNQSLIESLAEGTTGQTELSRTQLGDLKFDLPIDKNIQRQIGEAMFLLDSKIEFNIRINQTLETIAQTLFKSWFVDFDPVKAKIAAKEQGQDPQLAAMRTISGKTAEQIAQLPAEKRNELAATADLFPDEMVESELGMIPKGWKVRKIGEIYQTTSGGTPSRDKKHFFENGTIDWVKSKELTNSFVHKTEEQITKEAILNSSAKLLPPNTILLAMYGATVGQFAILGMPAACNQAICAILPNKTYPYTFIYSWLKENKENVMGRASGSAQQNISQIIIKGIDIIVPHVALIGVFHTKVGKSFDLLLSNIKENQTLSNLRDELLPQLLAGNIILEDGGVI